MGAVASLALLGLPARAQEPPPDARPVDAKAALAGVTRALALLAAAKGEAAAAAALGDDAPAGVARALAEVAASPRARDVRDLDGQLALQAAMVQDLLAELPAARAALDGFAGEASQRLERELGLVEQEASRLAAAAAALDRAEAQGGVPSRLAAAGREQGGPLLVLGARAPVVRRVLADAEAAPPERRAAERYRSLTEQFDREPDALAARGLVVLRRALARAGAELEALGAQAAARELADRLDARLAGALEALLGAAERAVEVSRRLRDRELLLVGQGSRGAELEQATRMAAAYRRQHHVPPALRATLHADVYADRASARIYVWLEGEDRWVEGQARVDPVEPVVLALLAASDPALRARAADPRAIARLYGLFEVDGGRGRPFTEGLEAAAEAARAASRRARALRDAGAQAGLTAAAIDEALVDRAGAPVGLLLPDGVAADLQADAAVARRVKDELLRAAVERGPEAARELLLTVEAAGAALARLDGRPAVAVVTGRPAGAAVDLAWQPEPAANPGAWLVAPPDQLPPGVERAGGLLIGQATARARAFAWDGQRVHAAEGRAGQGGTVALPLAPGGAGLVPVGPAGPRGQRVALLPRAGPAHLLVLAGAGDEAGRPLPVAPGGAWASHRPWDVAGPREVRAVDAQGQVVARLAVDLPVAAGVAVTVEGDVAPRPTVPPGAKVIARLLAGGKPVEGRRAFRLVDAQGQVVVERSGEALRWTADVPAGRYRLLVEGAPPAAVVVAQGAPEVVAAVHPQGAAHVGDHPAGAGLLLRVDAWPHALAEEVRRVRWRIEGPGGKVVEAVTRPGVEAPAAALLLPVQLAADAAAGPRRVAARLDTEAGAIEATGSFTVRAGARPVEVELRAPDGEALRALAPGLDGPLLRAAEPLQRPTWTLVAPSGRVRALAPRFDGAAAVTIDPDEPPGAWQAWLRGERATREPAAGALTFLVHAPAALEVAPPAQAPVGGRATLVVRPPAGFRPPFRIRRDGGPWSDGAALEVVVQAANDVALTLEDQDGRRARGSIAFAGQRSAEAEPTSAARFGLVADVGERRLFAVDHAQLQAYRRNDNLPRDWVVLEPGPLVAAKVRDRMFQTLPYDGSGGRDPQVAYRTKRFWAQLSAPARAGLLKLGVAEGEPFDVLVSPSPGGEETLKELAARHVAEHGGWQFRLVRVRVVTADGALPDREARDPQAELRLFRVQAKGEGRSVARIEVPGPLGELHLAPSFPELLDLGHDGRLAVSALARRVPLVPGRRYPGGWEALLPEAFLCPELAVEVDVEGRQRLEARVRHVGRSVAGADIGISLGRLGPEPAAPAPRRAERHRLTIEPFGPGAPKPLEVRFEPVLPGQLENIPRALVVTVRARLVPALPAARWPQGEPGERVTLEGAEVVLAPQPLPFPQVELQATYLRQAPDGPKPWPALLPPLGAVRAGAEAPPPPIDRAKALADADAALASGALDDAAAAARQAVFADPDAPEGWAALADVLLARRRPVEALAAARWAAGLGSSVRAWLVAGEALLADGDLDAAKEAAKKAGDLGPQAEPERRRLERLRAQLGD